MRTLFLVGFFIAVAAVQLLALWPDNFEFVQQNLWDKWQHLLAFAVLTSWASLLWPMKTTWVVGCMLLMGLQIEICQYFIPRRYADFPDLVADAIGCAFGLAAVLLVRRVRPVADDSLTQGTVHQ